MYRYRFTLNKNNAQTKRVFLDKEHLYTVKK